MEKNIKHIISELTIFRNIISKYSVDVEMLIKKSTTISSAHLKELVAINILNLTLHSIYYNTQKELLKNADLLFYSTVRFWLETSKEFKQGLGIVIDDKSIFSGNHNRLKTINNVQEPLLDWIKGNPPLLNEVDNLIQKYNKMKDNNTKTDGKIKAKDSFVYTNVMGGLQKVHRMPTKESLAYKGYASASVNTPKKTRKKRR